MSRTIGKFESTQEHTIRDRLLSDFPSGQWLDSMNYRQASPLRESMVFSIWSFLIQSQYARFFTANTSSHSLIVPFVASVSELPEVERVFWKVEDNWIRVWTIIDQPNREAENKIYDAQLDLMDKFPEKSFDFVVIFRQGKMPEEVHPEGAIPGFSRT